MEKRGKNNQFRRMQELAGVLNEIEVEDLETSKEYHYNDTTSKKQGVLKFIKNHGDTVEFEVVSMKPYRRKGAQLFLAPAKVKAYISLHD